MGRRGSCYANAAMESFWSTLELGLVCRRLFGNRRDTRAEIFGFIEVFYNRQRRHTSLGGLSPANLELLNNQPPLPSPARFRSRPKMRRL